VCFSASASFIAGTSLSAVGVATLKRTDTRREQPLAAIPLLFGVQQLAEGVIWLTFRYDAPLLRQMMTYVYTGFSHVLWPMYVPFAMGVLETVRWRKRMLVAIEGVGIAVGLYLLLSLVTHSVVAQVLGMHIVYVSPLFYKVPEVALYLTATCVSCFLSSHRFVRLFGAVALVSFVASYLAYSWAFVSIWCFFAAVLSLLIYVHIRFRHLRLVPLSSQAVSNADKATWLSV